MKMMRNIVVALSLILLSAPLIFWAGSFEVSNILARNELRRTLEAGRSVLALYDSNSPAPTSHSRVDVLDAELFSLLGRRVPGFADFVQLLQWRALQNRGDLRSGRHRRPD
jgi:hypothetical protein